MVARRSKGRKQGGDQRTVDDLDKGTPRSVDEYEFIAERFECLIRLVGLYIEPAHPQCAEAIQSFWNGIHGPIRIEGKVIQSKAPPIPSADELRQAAEVARFVVGAVADVQPRWHIVAEMHGKISGRKVADIGRLVQTATESVETYRLYPSALVIRRFLAFIAHLDPRFALLDRQAHEAWRDAVARGDKDQLLPESLAWLTELFEKTLRKTRPVNPSGLAARVALHVGALGVDPNKETIEGLTNAYRLAWRRWTG